mmetsp:Transcript_5231/g.11442  ORF Transcript_5231/g.11442 Transcript_5231/m.11442 type:complete len:590 (-) Transcript_5231:711-2480(-)
MGVNYELKVWALSYWCNIACVSFLLCLASTASAKVQVAQRSDSQTSHEISSALGWKSCRPAILYQPANTDEVADIIQSLHREHSLGVQKYLIRATHQNFFSHNNMSCPITEDATVLTVAIDTSAMKNLLQINDEDMTVTVQAGMTFTELEKLLLEHGLSLPGILLPPHIGGMTLGGALATASHGTALMGPASLAAYLRAAVLVDGTGDVHALDTPGDLLEGSLGLLGVITELSFIAAPVRKVAVKQLQEEDVEFIGDLTEIVENSHGLALDVTWSPSAGMYTARVWHETEPSDIGNAANNLFRGPSELLQQVEQLLARDQVDLHDEEGIICQVLGDITAQPLFVEKGSAGEADEEAAEQNIYNVTVGYSNQMGTSTCSEENRECFWQHAKLTPHLISFDSADMSDWVHDVRELLQNAAGCTSFLINFRFALASESPLAMHSGKQVVSVELSTYSSRQHDGTWPVKQQGLLEEILQMTLCNYGGRPHWSLSTNRMFSAPCATRDAYGQEFDLFMERRMRYDPHGIFLHPMFQRIADRSEAIYYPGCAIIGDCFCKEDRHCGHGHKCVSGYLYPDYKVCTPVLSHTHDGEL